MLISGINKFSSIDYPGKLACVVYTPGCNFRCKFCHNPEFVLPEMIEKIKNNFISEKAFFNFLEKRKIFLSGVSICGGEPTLQNGLYEFCKKVKDLGFEVKIDTNGGNPEILKKLVNAGLLDYIAMDIKHEIGKIGEMAGVMVNEKNFEESLDFVKNCGLDYEFRTTIVKGIHTFENIENIAKYLGNVKNYYLQNFKRNSELLDKNFSGESFSPNELEEFKKIAKKYVENVKIRN